MGSHSASINGPKPQIVQLNKYHPKDTLIVDHGQGPHHIGGSS